MNREQEVAAALCEHLPTAISSAGIRADSCIAHTRCSLFILQDLGIHAYAMPVKVVIMNDVFYARTVAEGQPADEATALEWKRAGAHVLKCGFGLDPDSGRPGWDGHLVTVVADRYIVDLSLGALNRPQKRITELGPIYFEAADFIAGKDEAVGVTLGRSRVIYGPLDTVSYLRAPDWRKPSREDPWVVQTLAKMPGAPAILR